ARLLILLPAGADEISARDALDRNHGTFADDHAASAQLVVRAHLRWKSIEARFQKVILDVIEVLEPEVRDLIKDFSFVWNARREDHIERRDAIGGDEQK